MEGKRAVSRSTQIAMEAFVPWVQHRLNDLLGVPQQDERRKVIMDVKEGLEAWIKHELNGVLGLQQEDKWGPVLLVPWIEHQLIDHLWCQRKNEGEIVADVKSKFDDILRPMITHQLRDLIVQIRRIVWDDLSGQQEDKALKLVMDPRLVSLIKHHLNDILSGKEQQGDDQKGMLASLIKHHLKDVLLGKEQQIDEKVPVAFLIKQHLKDVLSGKKQQADEKGMLVSLIKYQLSEILGEGQGKGDGEQKVAMAVSARVESGLFPSVKYQLGDQLKIDRPKIMQETRTRLEEVLKIAKTVLQELGDNDEKKKVEKQEAALWEWVDELISVSYQIIAVLEERKKIAMMNQVSFSVPSRVKKPRRRDKSASKLKGINFKLLSLKNSASGFSRTHIVGNDEFGSLVTSSLIDDSEVYCRKHDIKSVLKHLMPGTEEEEKAVKVMSIVGCGGSGKTTLAKCVFNDPQVAKHFEIRAWVSVSNFFDDKRLAQDLLRSVGKNEVKEWELDSVLFQLLRESFSGKVFLCVFDDLWTEDFSKWMRFALLFRNGAPGSRILVTTRSEKVARVVRADWKLYLKPLSNKDWWLIWRNRLVLSEKNKVSKQMVRIGSKIADKCNGSPLAAIALGQILLDKNTAEEWQGELKKVSDMGDEIWRMRDVALELFRHFHWSYLKLSPAVKLCILYCADFDKGTVIIVDQLIKMWMAQGYLGGSWEGDDTKTKRGLKYFDDLASHSFFQELVKGSIHKDKITSCKLSDTFHDFIRYEARHDLAALQWGKYSAVLEKRREIHFHHAYCQVPQNFNCTRWKDVSALVLSSSQLEEVPSEVGELSHVQYLDLSNNPLKELPEIVCKLEGLEYLDVHRCYLLLCLPQHIQKLKQLKHLRVDYTTDDLHKHLPKGFEELTLIRTLDVFKTGGSMYKDAMEKLKGFTDLTDICISVHGEVKFSDADFESKIHLKILELCFVEEGLDQEKASKIMEDLKPPPNLEMLKFDNYPLMELPKWILEQSLQIKTLKRLSFRSAMNIASFPALWKLPSLEFLWLYNSPKLKHIGREFLGLPDSTLHLKTSDFPIGEPDKEEDEIDYIDDDEEIAIQDIKSPEADKTVVSFPKLKTLQIECMKNLEKWQDLTEDEKKESLVLVMPSLEELIISRCPKLHGKPLRILGDTPWFKRTNPPYPMEKNAPPSSQQQEGCSLPEEKGQKNAPPPSQQKEGCSLPEEKEQKNAPPPSHQKEGCSLPEEKEKVTETSIAIEPIVPPIIEHRQVESNRLPDPHTMSFDRDSYMKLRKFVHDAYITKGSLDSFEVSIPKGVLGNTEITACLPLKDLYRWFQPNDWAFAEQLCIWSKLIYGLMTPSDKKRVQMVSSALITTVSREEGYLDTRDEVLVKFMIENKARLYLVPFLRPGHWELLAIVPENGVVYRFDSLQRDPTAELTDLVERVERRYVLETPNLNNLLGKKLGGS